jgi:hypothetical protein
MWKCIDNIHQIENDINNEENWNINRNKKDNLVFKLVLHQG